MAKNHGSSSLSSSIGTLAHEEIQALDDKPFKSTALVLHGLLGSVGYLRSFVRNLASELHKSSPSDVWRMVLVDLRNHGKSTRIEGLDPPHDMVNAAKDLANLVKTHEWAWPDVVIGHSMGGKVALEFAACCARGDYGESAVLPKQLWVLDSVPGEFDENYTSREVEKVLQTLQTLPSSFPSRKWVVDHMLGLGFSNFSAQWVGGCLKQEGENFVWDFDPQAVVEMFYSNRDRSYWSLLEHPPKGLEIEIVQAEYNDFWSDDVVERIQRLSRREEGSEEGKVSLHTLQKSGHMVHEDNPEGLIDIMVPNFYSKGL